MKSNNDWIEELAKSFVPSRLVGIEIEVFLYWNCLKVEGEEWEMEGGVRKCVIFVVLRSQFWRLGLRLELDEGGSTLELLYSC